MQLNPAALGSICKFADPIVPTERGATLLNDILLPVETITRELDGKLLLGGQFTLFNGVPRNRIVRLNEDGSVDLSFVIGTGTESSVNSIAVAPDSVSRHPPSGSAKPSDSSHMGSNQENGT